MTAFIRLLHIDLDDKQAALKRAINSNDGELRWIDPTLMKRIPGQAFVYWLSDAMIDLYRFNQQWEQFETRCGLGTLDDFRFLRLWFEVDASKPGWVPFAKGGTFSPFYPEIDLRLNWGDSGRELKASVEQKVGSASRKVQGQEFYFKSGVTWPRLPHVMGSFQVLPPGCIFSDGGPGLFAQSETEILAITAVLNSAIFLFLLETLMARGTEGGQTLKYEAGYVTSSPLPPNMRQMTGQLSKITVEGWRCGWVVARGNECSIHFVTLAGRENNKRAAVRMNSLLKECDKLTAVQFGLGEFDTENVEQWARSRRSRVLSGPALEHETDEVTKIESARFLSWAVGVVFGRLDIRVATGERTMPAEPNPFDSLPTISPGMLPDGEAPFTACGGVLVDDVGHANDCVASVAAVFDRMGITAPEQDALRRTFAHEFFPAHIKLYSKSRRKAPIYWQLATSSVSYSVWLYIHAFNKNTLFSVQNDYVAPKLAHEQRQLLRLRSEGGANPTVAHYGAIAAKEVYVGELQLFFDEVRRVAPLWHPDLDDGVLLNFAPLWRLVPQHKPWQKELKATWDALCVGSYDWSHLAMHLWPERVIPKCAEDHSFAIAHGLEELFWFEDQPGKWKPCQKPRQSVADLVRERTSSAVKAALKSLLEAPEATAGTKRGRKAKAA